MSDMTIRQTIHKCQVSQITIHKPMQQFQVKEMTIHKTIHKIYTDVDELDDYTGCDRHMLDELYDYT